MSVWNLAQVADALQLPLEQRRAIHTFSVDSRTLEPGSCFVALRGKKADGHAFLGEAKARGASAAIVESSYKGLDNGLALLRVKNPLEALQELASQTLFRLRLRVIALTGSVGKTTTKEFLRALLATKYRVVATAGNQNSQIGLPLTLLNHCRQDHEIAVLEMGMSKKGEIARLVSLASPEVALLTSVALAHAENFSSLQEIALAKAEIFGHTATRLGIFPAECKDLLPVQTLGLCKKQIFSLTCLGADWTAAVLPGGAIKVSGPKRDAGQLGPFTLPGAHNRHNLLAAVAVARAFTVEWEAMHKVCSTLTLPLKRFEIMHKQGILFINDAYNASPAAMLAALRSLPPKKAGRRIGVLGSMPELGMFSVQCHREVALEALKVLDCLYCLGESTLPMREVWEKKKRPVFSYLDKEELAKNLREQLRPNDVVLVKGANTLCMWELIEQI